MRKGASRYAVVDLFSGAGGLSEGFRQAGLEVTHAVDMDTQCLETIVSNRPKTRVYDFDMSETTPEEMVEEMGLDPGFVACVIGGPPCQGFSLQSRRTSPEEWQEDVRNFCPFHFVRFVQAVHPRLVLMENVPGILSLSRGEPFRDVLQAFDSIGYSVEWSKLNAVNYGVPQSRERVFIQAGLGIVPPFPVRTHVPSHLLGQTRLTGSGEQFRRWRTVRDAIMNGRDLSVHPNYHLPKHSPEVTAKLDQLLPGETPYGEKFRQNWRRLHADRPATAVLRSHSSGHVHPTEPRTLGLHEQALLQDFPMDYEFVGPRLSVESQIANAVPVGLARAFGLTFKRFLEKCLP